MANRVVILGGGYAGLRVAHDVCRAATARHGEVVLVAALPDHLDVASLYEVATARLKRESIYSSELISRGFGISLEEITAHWPVKVKIGKVAMISTADRLLLFEDKTSLSYDQLVLAVGAETALYGVPGVAEHAFSIKTLFEALRLRHHITRCLKQAQAAAGPERTALSTFVVVGAGATGVEVASELMGLVRHWQRVDHTLQPRVMLLEAGETLLKELPELVQQRVAKRLERLGIEVRSHCPVVLVGEREVNLRTGGTIATRTVIWAGGLQPAELLVRSHLPMLRWGVRVLDTLQVVGQPNIFAVGDCAVLENTSVPIPATVPVAYAQGALVAQSLLKQQRGEPVQPFAWRKRSQIITLGGKTTLLITPRGWVWIGWWPWLLKHAVLWQYWCRYVSPWRAAQLLRQQVAVETRND